MRQTELLIIGAGPYGLAVAACAKERGVDAALTGRSMEFWRTHMPAGMLLRSPVEWQLDPLERRTLSAFLDSRNVSALDAVPVTLDLFCEYAGWFAEGYALRPEADSVTVLKHQGDLFEAETDTGERIEARSVLLAPGAAPFAHIPSNLAAMLPPGSFSHTCNSIDLDVFRGRRCLIVGGRQSAYEWAALMAEAGATDVHISHRHTAPSFAEADWSWVGEMIDATENEPGWFRKKPAAEREQIQQRFYNEGRLKLEPWLPPRLDRPSIHVHPSTNLAGATQNGGGKLGVRLDDGSSFSVDHVLFATGYNVDMAALPLLSDGTTGPKVKTLDGFPVLDEAFQTTLPGLFVTGLASTAGFGPFFGFVAGCAVSARMIVEAVLRRAKGS